MQIAQNIVHLEETSSTNDSLLSYLSNVEPVAGLAITADYQTLGKGQIGRQWESEKGKNLLFSFVLYPNQLEVKNQFYISMMVSLAIRKTLLELSFDSVSIKWPNDIYVGNKKLCGILIQNTLKGRTIAQSIVGIGLNINQTSFSTELPNPTSMKNEIGKDYDINMVLGELVNNLNDYYEGLHKMQYDNISKEYHQYMFRINEENGFIYKGKEIKGTIKGVTNEGFLKIEDEKSCVNSFTLNELKFII